MKRSDFIKELSGRLNIDVETTKIYLNEMETLVLEVMALNDFVPFKFAKIGGRIKEPYRMSGFYRVLDRPMKNHGWTVAKGGSPYCEFTSVAKYYQPIDAEEFFNQVEWRYTSKARQYRIDCGLPEIEEYKDLSEEKIQELCKKADANIKKVVVNNMNKNTRERLEKLKEKNRKENQQRLINEDLENQRKNGVKEEDLVYKSIDQIKQELEEKWKSIQHPENWPERRQIHY